MLAGIHTSTYGLTNARTYIGAYISVCIQICVYICVHTHTRCVYTHIHIYSLYASLPYRIKFITATCETDERLWRIRSSRGALLVAQLPGLLIGVGQCLPSWRRQVACSKNSILRTAVLKPQRLDFNLLLFAGRENPKA